MKRSDLLFTALLVPTDFLMLIFAGVLVYYLRFSVLENFRPVIYQIPFKNYFFSVLIISVFWLIIFALSGLYSLSRKKFSDEFLKILIGTSLGLMFITLFIFFDQRYFSSRFIVLFGWILSIIFVSFGRLFIHFLQLFYYKKGKGLIPVLIFGQNRISNQLIQSIKANPGLGYKVIGQVNSVDELLNNWSKKAKDIFEIINTCPDLDRQKVLKIVDFCNEHQIVYKYTPDLFGALASNTSNETIAGIPLIKIKRTALDGWGRIVKRFLDIFFSLFGLIIFSPLFLIVSILIKIDSPGPVFVRLKRVGERGRIFNLFKFRSMVKNAQELKKDLLKYNERRDGPLFKMKNDPRITRIGRWLRRWSIDELPQLVNVLKGEMSIVGPRPHEPEEVDQYQKQHRQLLTIKPGITGLAQISGRAELSFNEEAKLDLYYIENWSIWQDVKILIKTIPAVISQKGAV
ncbi:sugar transferase [bacterium]|nr:sugar transferase [bacterium]